ncbi:MAG: hypothetical protein ACYCYI_11520 [Saccharofermentanales bacterium]
MKKSLLTVLIIVSFVMSFTASVPVFADSPQVLRNPGFEDELDYWVSAVTATLIALKSYEGTTPQAGEYFAYTDNRYGYADAPMQHIQNQMNFYGKGTYQLKAYMRLPGDSSVSTAKAKIVIQTISTDKQSGGAPQYPGMNWYTSDEKIINKTSWTLIEATVDIQWSQTLEACEYYFLTNQADPVTDICIDSASMIKTGYNGPAYSFPTPTPPKNSPTPKNTPTNPPVTSSPESSATSSKYVYSRSSVSGSSTTTDSNPASSSETSYPDNSIAGSQDNSTGNSTVDSNSGISEAVSMNSTGSTDSQIVSSNSAIPVNQENKDGKANPFVIAAVSAVILAAAALLVVNLLNKKKSTGNNTKL